MPSRSTLDSSVRRIRDGEVVMLSALPEGRVPLARDATRFAGCSAVFSPTRRQRRHACAR
eukprot:4414470-Pleurochrysis_carterae.AAC.1